MNKMKTIIIAINCYILTLFGCLAGNLSVETLGAVRFADIDGDTQWGAGVGANYTVNKFVAITGRALAYETPDNWGGSTVDEAGAGIAATILRAGRLALAATAVANYAFERSDFGLGAGGLATVGIVGGLYGLAGAEFRFWDKSESDILLRFGVGLKF